MAEHQEYLDRLRQLDDSVVVVVDMCQQFAALLRERRGRDLDAWTQEAEASGSTELQGFVRSIRQDWAPVVAG
jgi:transposase